MIKICIPSHNRPFVTTLNILESFNPEDIYIFVNDKTQKELYSDNKVNIVVTNTKGIPAARNAILDYFEPGTKILQLDDDIEEVYRLDFVNLKKKLRKMNNDEIKEFIENSFELCEKSGVHLWGVYPVYNAFYMSNQISNKGFVIGSFCGIINDEIRFDEKLPLKEDYDFSIKHILKYRKIARFDFITPKIKHYTNSGGCVETRKDNTNMEKECCDRLLRLYPKYFIRNSKRPNEVLMKL